MALTKEQIDKALRLPADTMVEAGMKKIKRGQMTFEELKHLCEMRLPEKQDTESVAKDLGIIQ